MKRYEFFQKINGNSPLSKRLDKIMDKMDLMRIVSAPVSFESLKHVEGEHIFYLCCLFEVWLHDVVVRLQDWVVRIGQYLDEYQGSWKYYAICQHRDNVKDGWGDEKDYDEEGNIVQRELSDEELCHYSIIGDIYYDDWRDIVQETTPSDLAWIKSSLQIHAENDFVDVFKRATGADINMYKKVYDEDGEVVDMEPYTTEERDLMKVSEMVDAEDDGIFITKLCEIINNICGTLKNLDRCQDNKETLAEIREIAIGMLELKETK